MFLFQISITVLRASPVFTGERVTVIYLEITHVYVLKDTEVKIASMHFVMMATVKTAGLVR